jgi:hypothetical protein
MFVCVGEESSAKLKMIVSSRLSSSWRWRWGDWKLIEIGITGPLRLWLLGWGEEIVSCPCSTTNDIIGIIFIVRINRIVVGGGSILEGVVLLFCSNKRRNTEDLNLTRYSLCAP